MGLSTIQKLFLLFYKHVYLVAHLTLIVLDLTEGPHLLKDVSLTATRETWPVELIDYGILFSTWRAEALLRGTQQLLIGDADR